MLTHISQRVKRGSVALCVNFPHCTVHAVCVAGKGRGVKRVDIRLKTGYRVSARNFTPIRPQDIARRNSIGSVWIAIPKHLHEKTMIVTSVYDRPSSVLIPHIGGFHIILSLGTGNDISVVSMS